jgi:hypothetical protein
MRSSQNLYSTHLGEYGGRVASLRHWRFKPPGGRVPSSSLHRARGVPPRGCCCAGALSFEPRGRLSDQPATLRLFGDDGVPLLARLGDGPQGFSGPPRRLPPRTARSPPRAPRPDVPATPPPSPIRSAPLSSSSPPWRGCALRPASSSDSTLGFSFGASLEAFCYHLPSKLSLPLPHRETLFTYAQ